MLKWSNPTVIRISSELGDPFGKEDRPEIGLNLGRPGVYVLVRLLLPGVDMPRLYIGVSAHPLGRLVQHQGEWPWQRAIVLTSNQPAMTRNHFRHIEGVLVEHSRANARHVIENIQTPYMLPLPADDRMVVAGYVEALVKCLRYLRVDLGDYIATKSYGCSEKENLEGMTGMELLLKLGGTLGVGIRQIIWYYGDKSAWVFLTETGTIRVDDIWTWRKFNEGWHAGGGHQVPNPGTNPWKSVVLAIVRASTVYDMRRIPQWTRDHAETWLAGYPAMHTRLEYPAFQDDRLRPFLLNGRTHIDQAHFWRWSRAYPATPVEPKSHQAELKNVGWVTAPLDIMTDGAVHTVTCWASPLNWRPPIPLR